MQGDPLPRALSACLRSGVPRLVNAAKAEIKARTKNLSGEKAKRDALHVSKMTWYEWRRDGLVDGGVMAAGRPRKSQG